VKRIDLTPGRGRGKLELKNSMESGILRGRTGEPDGWEPESTVILHWENANIE
jgi:hypothetical protein